MTKLGTTLGVMVKDNQDMKQSLTQQGGEPSWYQGFSENQSVHGTIVMTKKDISNVWIIGHPIFGELGSYQIWDGIYDDKTVIRVLNKNKTFYELFNSTTMINTILTTGSINTSTNIIELEDGEQYQSEIIALNNVAYTQAKIIIDADSTNGLVPYISFDGGSTFSETILDTQLTTTNTSTDGIIVKVSNESGARFPTYFGTWGEVGVTSNINKIQVIYN